MTRLRVRSLPWDAVATAAVCGGWAATPGHDANLNIDHAIFLSTVHFMRRGSGYYPAMDRALRVFIGPAATPRAFRMPTVFLIWRLLPADRLIWWILVVAVGLAAITLGRLVQARWVAPIVCVWFLYNAWNKFTLVEMWAVIIVIFGAAAWARGHRMAAASLGLAAALVRETTVLFLVGGLLAAHRRRLPRWPWVLALVLAGAAFAGHTALASHHLAAHGTESPLLGTGRAPFSVARWMGFGLPGGPVLGPVLWLVGTTSLLGALPPPRSAAPDSRRWPPVPGIDDLLTPTLLLPIFGVLVTRDYWGVLVVPFTLALSAGAIGRRLALRDRASRSPGMSEME